MDQINLFCQTDFHLLAASLTEMPVASAPAWVMLLFAAVMMATYVGVAVERFHKTVAALCGAVVLIILSVALGLFEYSKVYDFLKEDLNIFGVIIGTGILVDVVGKSGNLGCQRHRSYSAGKAHSIQRLMGLGTHGGIPLWPKDDSSSIGRLG